MRITDIKTRSPITVVSGCDEGYTLPLAVTMRSAINRLGKTERLAIYIIDGGITDASKDALCRSWADSRVSVSFVEPDLNCLRGFPVSHHVSLSTYLRFMIPDVLPTHVERAIYIDSDMLILRDLAELWNQPQAGNAVLAVQECAAPFIDSNIVLANERRRQRHLAAMRPIANYEQLGIPPTNKYFNGGLLVVDVEYWRKNRVAKELLQCLADHRDHVLWWDQYALNAVLHDRWGELDLRWNQGAHLYCYPSPGLSPFDAQTYGRLLRDPWIVHFCSPSKPWNYFCSHPWTRAFYRCMTQTEWRDYRPKRPHEFAKQWWTHHSAAASHKVQRFTRTASEQLKTLRKSA